MGWSTAASASRFAGVSSTSKTRGGLDSKAGMTRGSLEHSTQRRNRALLFGGFDPIEESRYARRVREIRSHRGEVRETIRGAV